MTAQRRERRSRTLVAMAAAAALGVAACTGVHVAPSARAWWSDAVSDQVTVTAGRVPTTTLRCGALGVLSVTFTWDAVPGATSYVLHYGQGGQETARTTATSRTITATVTNGTAWVVVERDFGSTTWTSAASNTRSYTVAVASLCG